MSEYSLQTYGSTARNNQDLQGLGATDFKLLTRTVLGKVQDFKITISLGASAAPAFTVPASIAADKSQTDANIILACLDCSS